MSNIVNLKDYKKKRNRKQNHYSFDRNPYSIVASFAILFVVILNILERYVSTPVTYSLIAINGVIFGLISCNKVNWYPLSTSYENTIGNREYYRLVSSAFTHQEAWHILMNMYSLYNLGNVLEPFLGRNLFLAAYLVIMLVGGYFSCRVHKRLQPYANSIGASGVLCGLMGMYLVFAFRIWGIAGIRSCASSLIILVLMLFSKRIDNIGHFTGLLTGIAWGCVLIMIS